MVPSFNQNIGFIAFGGYIWSTKPLKLIATIKYENDYCDPILSQITKQIFSNQWDKFGVFVLLDLSKLKSTSGKLSASIVIDADEIIKKLNFYGVDLGVVTYYQGKDVLTSFKQKTDLYIPEIFYFQMDQPFVTKPIEYSNYRFLPGRPIVLKSCNRCARYLLIDIENERNAISFSNHCISRAPCTHTLFANYSIEKNECSQLPQYILDKASPIEKLQTSLDRNGISISKIKTYYGYQLECRVCKKFVVNAPLNPLRNSTQHREDSLRRRSLEVLVDELLEKKWVYHRFRMEKNKEFDVFIWEKFGKKCFNCGKELISPNEMDLDHTMPLAMLWPLDDTATCLCKTCNSQKRDRFPCEFYKPSKIKDLAKITGIDFVLLGSRAINQMAIDELVNRIVWFFDDFLKRSDYQKVRQGKRVSDLIYKSIVAAIQVGGLDIDLIKEYITKTGYKPTSITLN